VVLTSTGETARKCSFPTPSGTSRSCNGQEGDGASPVSFATEVDGEELLVLQGESYPADDPVVKGREVLFEK
jgi:hypothetical protein